MNISTWVKILTDLGFLRNFRWRYSGIHGQCRHTGCQVLQTDGIGVRWRPYCGVKAMSALTSSRAPQRPEKAASTGPPMHEREFFVFVPRKTLHSSVFILLSLVITCKKYPQ